MRSGALFLCLVLLGFAGYVSAQDREASPAEVAKRIEADFPPVKAANVRPSPIQGVYEFTAFDGRILYYSPAGPHIIAGAIVAPGGKNLTAERTREIAKEKLANLPLDKAVRIGSGPKKVIEVSDPDCPYCRKAAAWFKERSDVTRYVFFVPLDFHPDAPAKIKAILCAEAPAVAYEEALSGTWDGGKTPKECGNGQGLLEGHRAVAVTLAVSGTPQFWVEGEQVSGADFGKLGRILDKKEVRKND